MKTTEERADRARGVTVYGAHSLRHYFVTQATAAGLPGAVIKSITGHATDSMLEHYQQIGIEFAGEVAKRIGNGKPPILPAAAGQSDPHAGDGADMRAALQGILELLNAGDVAGAQRRIVAMIG